VRIREKGNILRAINKRKVKWIGHICRRNCFLKHIIEGNVEERIEETVRRGRRRKHILDDLAEKRGCCKLKEEALDRTLWRTGFGKRLWTCRKTEYGRNEPSAWKSVRE
jgi:hypothetical protein